MPDESIIIRSDDPRADALLAAGWRVAARSWGARLDGNGLDPFRLAGLVQCGSRQGIVRELTASDVPAALALDAATLADYPGGPATRHEPLNAETARVTAARRAFGVFADGDLLAVTFIDVDGAVAETDFTVVAREHRGRGLGLAVKAACVLTLLADGVRTFRTGGAAENTAIRRANAALGYVVDEEWLTLVAPGE